MCMTFGTRLVIRGEGISSVPKPQYGALALAKKISNTNCVVLIRRFVECMRSVKGSI